MHVEIKNIRGEPLQIGEEGWLFKKNSAKFVQWKCKSCSLGNKRPAKTKVGQNILKEPLDSIKATLTPKDAFPTLGFCRIFSSEQALQGYFLIAIPTLPISNGPSLNRINKVIEVLGSKNLIEGMKLSISDLYFQTWLPGLPSEIHDIYESCLEHVPRVFCV